MKKKKPAAKKAASGAKSTATKSRRKAAPAGGTKKAARKAAPKKASARKTSAAAKKSKVTKKTSSARKARGARKTTKKRFHKRKLDAFRSLLLDKHHNLVQAYSSSKGSSRMVTRDGTEDYIDYAVSSYDRDFVLSLTEMDRHRLRLVEEALRRTETGEYGRCQQCAQDIPEPRLQVEPWARYCIRCQELDEQGLLQPRFESGDAGEDDEELSDEEVVGDEPIEEADDDGDGDDSDSDDDDGDDDLGL